MGAMIQKGPYKLHPRAKRFLISPNEWRKLSEEDQANRVLEFTKGIKRSKKSETITDRQGILNLPASLQQGGKKPGQTNQKARTISFPKSQSKKTEAQKTEKVKRFPYFKKSQVTEQESSDSNHSEISGIGKLGKTPAKTPAKTPTLAEDSEQEIAHPKSSRKATASSKPRKTLAKKKSPWSEESEDEISEPRKEKSSSKSGAKEPKTPILSQDSEHEVAERPLFSSKARSSSKDAPTKVSRVSQRPIKEPKKFTPSAYENKKSDRAERARKALSKMLSAKDPLLRKIKKNFSSSGSDN